MVVQVWTPLQFARALVQSFPWTPDPLSIANCVAAGLNEPSAESILAGNGNSAASTGSPSKPSAAPIPPGQAMMPQANGSKS
jgi:hypothetical protein